MYAHVLVPLDRSSAAEEAIGSAFHIAEASGARVTLLTVVEDAPVGLTVPERARSGWRAEAAAYMTELNERLPEHAVPIATHVASGHVAEAIRRFAAQESIDLIVMATHGAASQPAFALGGTAWNLLQTAKLPVLLVPSRSASAAIAAEAATATAPGGA
jgi:nucleotide-binding universal stress UspA family protein